MLSAAILVNVQLKKNRGLSLKATTPAREQVKDDFLITDSLITVLPHINYTETII